MKIRIVQDFGALDAWALTAAYRTASMYESFRDLPFVGAGQALTTSQASARETANLRVRWNVQLDLPAAARSFVDPSRLSFVEEMTLRPDGSGEFMIAPDHYAKLLKGSGTTVIAENAGVTSRVTEGNLRVDLGWKGKLFEGEVERAILNGLTQALQAQVPQVRSFIATAGEPA